MEVEPRLEKRVRPYEEGVVHSHVDALLCGRSLYALMVAMDFIFADRLEGEEPAVDFRADGVDSGETALADDLDDL